MNELLSPDNHALFDQVRLMAVKRHPAMPWEEIAARVGVDDVNELLAWFLSYRLPKRASILPSTGREPRDPELRARLARNRRREESLVTVVNESPVALARVQREIASLERMG